MAEQIKKSLRFVLMRVCLPAGVRLVTTFSGTNSSAIVAGHKINVVIGLFRLEDKIYVYILILQGIRRMHFW